MGVAQKIKKNLATAKTNVNAIKILKTTKTTIPANAVATVGVLLLPTAMSVHVGTVVNNTNSQVFFTNPSIKFCALVK